MQGMGICVIDKTSSRMHVMEMMDMPVGIRECSQKKNTLDITDLDTFCHHFQFQQLCSCSQLISARIFGLLSYTQVLQTQSAKFRRVHRRLNYEQIKKTQVKEDNGSPLTSPLNWCTLNSKRYSWTGQPQENTL